jgi:hypothetical protein
VPAQGVDVGLIDLRREVCQLDRELAQRALAGRQLRLAPVVLRVLRQFFVCALSTEVVGMCPRSVVAALLG